MRGFRQTWIFAIVVSVVSVFAYIEYTNMQKEKRAEQNKNKLFSELVTDNVNSITIKKNKLGDMQSSLDMLIELTRKDPSWRMTKPVSDLANEKAVSDFLQRIKDQEGEVIQQSSSSPDQLAQYGLNAPLAEITLTAAENEVHFFVGAVPTFDGRYYIKKGDKVYIGSKAWGFIAGQQPVDFRDRHLFKGQAQPVHELIIQPVIAKNKSKLHLVKDNNRWTSRNYQNLPLDQSKVANLMSSLQDLTYNEVLSETTDADLKTWGLSSSQRKTMLTVNVENDGSHRKWTLDVGQRRDHQYFVKSSSDQKVVAVNEMQLKELEKNIDQLADLSAAFHFIPEAVRKIQYSDDKVFYEFIKSDKWALAARKELKSSKTSSQTSKEDFADKDKGQNGQDQKYTANSITITDLLASIARMRADSVILKQHKALASMGLKSPLLEVKLFDDQGLSLLQLQFGRRGRDKNSEKIYVLSSASSYPYMTDFSNYKELIEAELVNAEFHKANLKEGATNENL